MIAPDSSQEQPIPLQRKKEKPAATPERHTTPEQREREAPHREALLRIVSRDDLPTRSALEVVAKIGETTDPKLLTEVRALSEAYGIAFDDLPPGEQRQLSVLYRGAKEGSRPDARQDIAGALDRTLHDHLVARAFKQLGDLRDAMTRAESVAQMKERLRTLMGSMSSLARQVSPERPDNQNTWQRLFDEFTSLVALKTKAGGDIGKGFGEIFDEHQEFIENEFVIRESQRLEKTGKPHSAEHLMQEIFGRTPEEIEAIKKRNRTQAVEFISQHKDDAPTIEVLQELHRINNDGIIPRQYARFRRGEEVVGFGKRFGIIGQDVREEMEDFEARATLASLERTPRSLYEMTVAKLHNDMLDIHPFPDRNGSTGMLFMEFMMAKRGYGPEAERDPKYYNWLRKILGNNPVAIGIVGHGHWQIANVPGYYEKGKTTKGKERMYESVLNLIGQRMKKSKEDPAAKPRLGKAA